MPTATLTLTDFLLARIAEDEAVARDAMAHPIFPDYVDEGPAWFCREQSDHVALAPARLLAECEAKRAIVEHCVEAEGNRYGHDDWVIALDHVLRLLARPFADHADYRNEWRP